MDEKPRNLRTMLSEAKDTSELMVDLAYAAVYFGDPQMAEEVDELEDHLNELVHDMRAVCVMAARAPREADAMASVLQVVSSIEPIGNAAVDSAHIDVLVEMKNISMTCVGLAWSALVLRDQGLAAEVNHLEDRLDEMKERLETWVLRSSADSVDPSPLRGLLHLAEASEDLGDAAQQMVWLVEKQEEVHPILSIALGDADEVVVRLPVGAGSRVDGASLAELHLDIDPGFHVLAVRRGGR